MILCFAEMAVFFVDYACFLLMPSDGWWRLPVALQVIPAVFLAAGCWRSSWVPPSPRWLVAQERYDCALEVLTRLHGGEAAAIEMAEIKDSVGDEQAGGDMAQASWSDMFRGPVLRVTMLGVTIQFLQQATGTNAIFYYTPKLFHNGGITDPNIANLATSGVGVVLFLSSWIPIFYYDRLGRKTWLQLGLVGMFTALIGIAVLQRHAETHPGDPRNYAIIAFPFLFFTFFNMSWSSGSWLYAAEIFPISLRVSSSRPKMSHPQLLTSVVLIVQGERTLHSITLDSEFLRRTSNPAHHDSNILGSLPDISSYQRSRVRVRPILSC